MKLSLVLQTYSIEHRLSRYRSRVKRVLSGRSKMKISFIVTTYNIESYIGRCLDSLAEVVRPGDQILILDDGSTDGTLAAVERFIASGRVSDEVEITPVFFGENTMGGVGIAGNIGMDMARRDVVFFVDGDDWIDPDGFREARLAFEQQDCDVLIANYQEYDEKNDLYKVPADTHRWNKLRSDSDLEERRHEAVEMIAVPWRKFYRRAFLEEHKLRFPEGDYFFEDNPFHWDVCMKAERLAFANTRLCYHRVNRPGQTMASTGQELGAFFDHYDTIRAKVNQQDNPRFERQAAAWILNNMSWHIGRLHRSAAPFYFKRAEAVMQHIGRDTLEHEELASLQGTQVSLYASLLLEEGWRAALDYFAMGKSQGQIEQLQRDLKQTRNELKSHIKATRNHATALSNAQYYETLHKRHHVKTSE